MDRAARAIPREGDAGTAWELLCPPARQHLPRLLSAPPEQAEGTTFRGGFREPENRSWRSPRRKCTGPWGPSTATAVGSFPSPSPAAARPRTPAEFRGSTLWSHSFASIRFHVLLNSLFKVLFNFPSRYLFTIGLVPVFSLRWSIPPTLGCIPKQPDSRDANTRDSGRASYGPITR